MSKHPGYPIFLVRWLDAQTLEVDGLAKVEDLDEIKPAYCETVGHLVKETNDYVVLAAEAWDTGQFKYVNVIPKPIICYKKQLTGKKLGKR